MLLSNLISIAATGSSNMDKYLDDIQDEETFEDYYDNPEYYGNNSLNAYHPPKLTAGFEALSYDSFSSPTAADQTSGYQATQSFRNSFQDSGISFTPNNILYQPSNIAHRSGVLQRTPIPQNNKLPTAYQRGYQTPLAGEHTSDPISDFPPDNEEYEPVYEDFHPIAQDNQLNVRLIPTSRLADMYRDIFSFGVFNAVQSASFHQIMESSENMIISAPTGSGKTVLFELAIVKLLMSDHSPASKCIYMSPTKALCSEKFKEWSQKFQGIGVKCCELTGDTITHGKGAWSNAKEAKIMNTFFPLNSPYSSPQPEKLDSLSRNWGDYESIFNTIKLVCVDEVHILGETRGSTLEACISRMKLRAQCRFILVSATVPNASDIAKWIGSRSEGSPARCLQFGDEYRPTKLTRVVYGYQRNNGNSFQFDRILNSKLFGILEKHCQGKPVLVFCSTRKGVTATAERIAKDYKAAQSKNRPLPWRCVRTDGSFVQTSLQDLSSCGVGVHHAGLALEDRRKIEKCFLNGELSVLVATSTLAVGVNLPCHTVIIKGVEMWDGTKTKEYSDLDIIQMMGRAGRPQFDKEGVAIILCDTEQRQKYQQNTAMLSTLESTLHLSLPEHLNSEVVSGAITDVDTAHKWLRNTFLFTRVQLNPSHYHIAMPSAGADWVKCFDELVEAALEDLEANRLLSRSETQGVEATPFGTIAAKSYVRHESMKHFIELPDNASKRDVLQALCKASESVTNTIMRALSDTLSRFKDVRLRSGERPAYNQLCQHQDIRFGLKRVETPTDKVFILLQAILGGISLSAQEYKNPDSILPLEAVTVYRNAVRLIRCIVETAISRQAGGALKHGLELHRSLVAKAWEDRPVVLRQLEGIGEKSIKVLAARGITTIDKVSAMEPREVEMWLNRKSPFGRDLIAAANAYPRCTISIEEIDIQPSFDGSKPVVIMLKVTCSAQIRGSLTKMNHLGTTSILTCTSNLQFMDYRRISTKALLKEERVFVVSAKLTKPSEDVEVHISPDFCAGMGVTQVYKHKLRSNQFPMPDTRPAAEEKLSSEGDLFWKSSEETGKDNWTDEESKKNAVVTKEVHTEKGHEVLPGGQLACNHRCKDKSACHHRCCQEGIVQPNPKSSSISCKSGPGKQKISTQNTSKRNEDSTQGKTNARGKLSKQSNDFNLLDQFDDVHSKTRNTARFNSGRLTLPRSRNKSLNLPASPQSDTNKDPESEDRKNRMIAAKFEEFDFSDEEMDKAMIALPISGSSRSARESPKVVDMGHPHSHGSRKRKVSVDVEDEDYIRKKQKKERDNVPRLKIITKRRHDTSSEIIEFSSSVESTPDFRFGLSDEDVEEQQKVSRFQGQSNHSNGMSNSITLANQNGQRPVELHDESGLFPKRKSVFNTAGNSSTKESTEQEKAFQKEISSLMPGKPNGVVYNLETEKDADENQNQRIEDLDDDAAFDRFFSGIDIV